MAALSRNYLTFRVNIYPTGPLHAMAEHPDADDREDPAAPGPPGARDRGDGKGGPQEYAFQYTQNSGMRKALLIGICYFGQRGHLRGCINDVKNMAAYLREHLGYKRDDMVILTDDQQNPMSQPTKANILRAMHWLVKGARPNDMLFFHYSGEFILCRTLSKRSAETDAMPGYGGQNHDLFGDSNDDEEEESEEIIYPVDFRTVGHIAKDQRDEIMVSRLQPGVKLTVVLDSIHAKDNLHHPYISSTHAVHKEPFLAKEADQALLDVISSYSREGPGSIPNNIMDSLDKSTSGDKVNAKGYTAQAPPADVVIFSGSKDYHASFVPSFLYCSLLLCHVLGC